MDPIQRDLEAWVLTRDRVAFENAIQAIAREWQPRIRSFYHGDDAEAEVALWEAIEEKVYNQGERPKVLLDRPGNAKAHRTTVIQRWLISRHRSRVAREKVGQLLPRPRDPDHPVVVEPKTTSHEEAVETAQLRSRDRGRVLDAAAALAIRRRVAVLLLLGADALPLAPALARDLGESDETVAARMERAAALHDVDEEAWLLACCRVLQPGADEGKARENWRKTTERATTDLSRALLGVRGDDRRASPSSEAPSREKTR